MTTSTSGPAPYYFISYCRQEVTFVDSFSRALEQRGICTWVDFRKLVPGQPWQPQLDDGVANAAAILLVASKASMASAPCKDEWTKSLAADKRIILIVFEPCKIAPELAGLEWVDFTGDFETALKQLAAVLARSAEKMTATPPREGIRLPGAAKMFYSLSIAAAVLGVLGGVFVFLLSSLLVSQEILLALSPDIAVSYESNELRSLISMGMFMSLIFLWAPAVWNFARIPWRIRTRTHDAGQLRGAVNSLVFANLFLLLVPMTALMTNIWTTFGSTMGTAFQGVMCVSLPLMLVIFGVCLWLYRLLISDSMYRWAGPTGALIQVTRPSLAARPQNGISMRIAVEAAPQDRLYADAINAALVKAGHTPTQNPEAADLILPLLSVYKNNSSGDPEKTRLIPVLLQRCDVDPRLSQVQWVDLRYGQASIDAVANLLEKPRELLSTLGVLPVRTTILPQGVKRLTGALSIVMFISVVFGIMNFLDLSNSGFAFVANTLIAAGTYVLRRYITDRKFKNLPFVSYWPVLGFAAFLALLALFAGWYPAWLLVPFAWLVPLLMLSKEVRMWVPAK